MLNGLDLFSGIGGLTRALAPWVRPLAYCEKERYAQAVLLSRMANGEIARGPIWDDVATLTGNELGWPWTDIDIIYGGFPCQDISCAGRGVGLGGERSGLYFEIERLIDEIRPTFVFLENVPAIRTRGLGRVVTGLAGLGYDCRWTVVSAAEVGAPHLRKRWFLLAHTNGERLRDRGQRSAQGETKASDISRHDGPQKPVAHAEGCRLESVRDGVDDALQRTHGAHDSDHRGCEVNMGNSSSVRGGSRSRGQGEPQREPVYSIPADWWETEPDVGRVAHGVPLRVDRIRGLGNAVVPAQAREAFMRLMGFDPYQSSLDKYGLEEG